MKKTKIRVLLFLAVAGLIAPAGAADKTSVAVYPIKAVGGVDKSLAQTMTSLLGYELSQSPKLIYIREDMLKEVMKRQAQNISDACDSTLCQVEIGKLVQAQKMVVGDLSKLGSLYILTVNLIDVQTGAVENTFKERCACSEDQLEQLASAAGNKIREHFGEMGLTVQAPAPPSSPPQLGPGPAEVIQTLPSSESRPYCIQVGASQNKEEAEAIKDKLAEKKYDVYVVKVEIPGKGTWYRIRIGHYRNREQADKALLIIRAREPEYYAFVTK